MQSTEKSVLQKKVSDAIELFWKNDFAGATRAAKSLLQNNPNERAAKYVRLFANRARCDWTYYNEDVEATMNLTREEINQSSRNEPTTIDCWLALFLPFTGEELRLITVSTEFGTPQVPPIPLGNKQQEHPKLKIGYMSSDADDHPLSHLLEAVPYFHNKDRFDIIFINTAQVGGSISERALFAGCTSVIHVFEKEAVEAAKAIRDLQLDILVDLNGKTAGSREDILQLRPAKCIATWIGFPCTSGSLFTDYIFIDEVIAPLAVSDQWFTETRAYLPHCYLPCSYKTKYSHLSYKRDIRTESGINYAVNYYLPIPDWISSPPNVALIHEMIKKDIKTINIKGNKILNGNHLKFEKLATDTSINGPLAIQLQDFVVSARKHFKLPNDSFVYGSFNKTIKLAPHHFRIWLKVMKAVENSVLIIQGTTIIQNLTKEAKNAGVDPKRIIFVPVDMSKECHLRRLQMVDLCLDTTICNGHTTSLDALWVGTPVLTIPQNTFQSRVSASLLSTLNVKGLIVDTPKEFETRAIRLGKDRELCCKYSTVIQERKNASNLFNMKLFAAGLENLYEKIAEQHSAGQKTIIIPPATAEQFSNFNEGFSVSQFVSEPLDTTLHAIEKLKSDMTKSFFESAKNWNTTDDDDQFTLSWIMMFCDANGRKGPYSLEEKPTLLDVAISQEITQTIWMANNSSTPLSEVMNNRNEAFVLGLVMTALDSFKELVTNRKMVDRPKIKHLFSDLLLCTWNAFNGKTPGPSYPKLIVASSASKEPWDIPLNSKSLNITTLKNFVMEEYNSNKTRNSWRTIQVMDNEVYGFYDRIILTPTDLLSIGDKHGTEEYTDGIIDGIIASIIQESLQDPLSLRRGWYVSASTVNQLASNDEGIKLAAYVPLQKAFLELDQDVLCFFLVHVPNNRHYILVVVDRISRKIEVFNPQHQLRRINAVFKVFSSKDEDISRQQVLQKLTGIIRFLENTDSSDDKNEDDEPIRGWMSENTRVRSNWPNGLYYYSEIPGFLGQKDGYSCGPLCCAYIEYKLGCVDFRGAQRKKETLKNLNSMNNFKTRFHQFQLVMKHSEYL